MVWWAILLVDNEVHTYPKWVLLTVFFGSHACILTILGPVRAHLRKKMYARRTAEAAGAGNRDG
jgi:hypothetical protein